MVAGSGSLLSPDDTLGILLGLYVLSSGGTDLRKRDWNGIDAHIGLGLSMFSKFMGYP
jgi:hypothetical protein